MSCSLGFTREWDPVIKKSSRQLATAVTGGKTLSFTYNDEGIRTSKTVDGVKHTYTLDGSRIMTETWGNQMLVYLYDDEGMPMGMMYRTSLDEEGHFDYYLLEKDVFGNIVAVPDRSEASRIPRSDCNQNNASPIRGGVCCCL